MGLGDWINRKRHNRGFGIQSPSAFFFVTQVLKERLPYYAYSQLDRATLGKHGLSPKQARELFRITNYRRPTNCITIGSPSAACAMAAAKPSALHYLAATADTLSPAIQEMLKEKKCNIMANCNQLTQIFEEAGNIGMLYIAPANNIDKIFEAALPYTDARSLIVIEGIHRNKAMRQCWQKIVSESSTVITYDMHSYGLILFDKERCKQNYTLKR